VQQLSPNLIRDKTTGQVYEWDGSRWRVVPAQKRASGGLIPGSGNGDTVPALLTPGEFVMTKAATAAIGVERLRRANETPTRFATGGLVGRGSTSVLTAQPSGSTRSSSRSVDVSPTINITATEPTRAADEVIRKLRRATFLAGVR
jgi:hypothetical protein